ncbi:class I SAM-dependent methyltransferase [Seleniivibrio woodruffii]|uniref:class I SAM-dependent methyltransferase n=1 Tax=Seleniivibrio woodruffii TaxID=1078050 RepID=UPI0026F2F0D5|nr:class I SAM-dependent methyltransferase [Seleniivibrio woodruffii]
MNETENYCSICGNGSSPFKSYGGRTGVLCPVCGSLERHRFIWHVVSRECRLSEDVSFLHFAPEQCFYDKLASSGIKYFPVDINPERFKNACTHMNATDIKFPDSSMDIVMANHLLEHIPDDIKAMKEFFRVLKNGGIAVLTVPIKLGNEKTYEDFSITDPQEREKAFGQSDHVRWYGRDFTDRLKRAGFHIEEFFAKDCLSDSEIRRQVIDRSPVYICRKRI